MVRQILQKGYYRITITVLFILLWSVVYYFGIMSSETACSFLPKFYGVCAAVVSALGVVVYNLRNRVIDFSLKIIEIERSYKEVGEKSKVCSVRLTNAILTSLVVAISCMIAGVIDCNQVGFSLVAYLAGASFIYAIVLYVYTIFAFEELEEQVIRHHVRLRELKEKQRNMATIEQKQRDFPDNF